MAGEWNRQRGAYPLKRLLGAKRTGLFGAKAWQYVWVWNHNGKETGWCMTDN